MNQAPDRSAGIQKQQADIEKQRKVIIEVAIYNHLFNGSFPKVFTETRSLPTCDLTEGGFKSAAHLYIKNTVENLYMGGRSVGEIVKSSEFSPNKASENILMLALGNIIKGGLLELGMHKADAWSVDSGSSYKGSTDKLAATILILNERFKNPKMGDAVQRAMEKAMEAMVGNPLYALIIADVKDLVKNPTEFVVTEILAYDPEFAKNDSFSKLLKEIKKGKEIKELMDSAGTGTNAKRYKPT